MEYFIDGQSGFKLYIRLRPDIKIRSIRRRCFLFLRIWLSLWCWYKAILYLTNVACQDQLSNGSQGIKLPSSAQQVRTLNKSHLSTTECQKITSKSPRHFFTFSKIKKYLHMCSIISTDRMQRKNAFNNYLPLSYKEKFSA